MTEDAELQGETGEALPDVEPPDSDALADAGLDAPSLPAQPTPNEPVPPGAQRVAVEIGDDGAGQGFVGLDIDDVALWNPPADCSVGLMAAHTVGISCVFVSGAQPGSVVDVIVLPKS